MNFYQSQGSGSRVQRLERDVDVPEPFADGAGFDFDRLSKNTVYGYADDLAAPRARTRPIGGAPKRVFDIVFSLVAIIVLSPVLAFVAVLIRLSSAGPCIYRQRRGGFGGGSFIIYKFRTMKVHTGPLRQAVASDNRVTRLGDFLRCTSIDELPQLINILKGEMSLVGPRPHAIEHDYAFSKIEVDYLLRFTARPGLTGLAQVQGARGVIDTVEQVTRRTQLDLDYVNNWRFGRDIGIIAATIKLLLKL